MKHSRSLLPLFQPFIVEGNLAPNGSPSISAEFATQRVFVEVSAQTPPDSGRAEGSEGDDLDRKQKTRAHQLATYDQHLGLP